MKNQPIEDFGMPVENMFIGSRCRGNEKNVSRQMNTRVCTKELENKNKKENVKNCQLCDSIMFWDLENTTHAVGLGGGFDEGP